jgi:hypothetical protein
MANITYRVNSSPVIPGATYVKSSPLTHSEIDANFKSLDNDTIQLKGDVGNILIKVDTIEKNVNPVKRKIQIEGDGIWSVDFNGKSDVKGDLKLNQVNPNIGQFGSGDRIPIITVNSKGLITAVRTSEVTAVTNSVVFIGDSPPVNPSIGQLWYDSSIEDRGFIWSGTGWVDFCPQAGGFGGNTNLIVDRLAENINIDNINSLKSTTAGKRNIIIGFNAGQNTSSDENTAIGYKTQEININGTCNTSVGAYSLQKNVSSYNTALGHGALLDNTTGGNNTAAGHGAMRKNIGGGANSAFGVGSLFNNTSGYNNTAVGYWSLFNNNTGISNTAVGLVSLGNNTTGSNNTAIGENALGGNVTGSNNTSVGYHSLIGNTTGSHNTAIGTQFNELGNYAPAYNCTTENNRVSIAHTGVTNAYVAVAWTVVSDLRDKVVSGPVQHGLEFVNQLKPIQYRFRTSRDLETPHGPVKYGFGAQDILAIEGDNPVVVDTEVPEKLKMVDSHLLPILVNAIQEMHNEIKTLKLEINALKGNA